MTNKSGSRAVASIDQHTTALRSDPLYLDRCQVDTPDGFVELAWKLVDARRDVIDKVVDFGAGDARFARYGAYSSYVGYEIDVGRFSDATTSDRVRLIGRCAFSYREDDADLCIGNPPYVRNQDLPTGWREMAASEVRRRTGVSLSGLANAWQYFLMLALASVKSDGLVVQIVPYEWVSRPAAAQMRQWILSHRWAVDVYRLPDGVFSDVLTAASITIIDKRARSGKWSFHEISSDGLVKPLPSPTSTPDGVVAYSRPAGGGARAKRGLSPGTQRVLTLTEGERVHHGLIPEVDVVRCITSLRHVSAAATRLSVDIFNDNYRDRGVKCWLIRTNGQPSVRLAAYIESIPESAYQTATCLGRQEWWRFRMPAHRPQILVAQAFKGVTPKVMSNDADVIPVGGVAGIYDLPEGSVGAVLSELRSLQMDRLLVPYAKQMHKVEINQLNTLLGRILDSEEERADV